LELIKGSQESFKPSAVAQFAHISLLNLNVNSYPKIVQAHVRAFLFFSHFVVSIFFLTGVFLSQAYFFPSNTCFSALITNGNTHTISLFPQFPTCWDPEKSAHHFPSLKRKRQNFGCAELSICFRKIHIGLICF